MEIVNGKMVVTEPQEFDLAKTQISTLASRHQSLQEALQRLSQNNVAHGQEFERTKNQINLLENRYRQIEAGVQSLTQKQLTLGKNAQAYLRIQEESKTLRSKIEQLSRQLRHQREQQKIWVIVAATILSANSVWTEIRIAKLQHITALSQQQIQLTQP